MPHDEDPHVRVDHTAATDCEDEDRHGTHATDGEDNREDSIQGVVWQPDEGTQTHTRHIPSDTHQLDTQTHAHTHHCFELYACS